MQHLVSFHQMKKLNVVFSSLPIVCCLFVYCFWCGFLLLFFVCFLFGFLCFCVAFFVFLCVFLCVFFFFWGGGLVYNPLHNQPSISDSFIRQSIKSITQTDSETNT